MSQDVGVKLTEVDPNPKKEEGKECITSTDNTSSNLHTDGTTCTPDTAGVEKMEIEKESPDMKDKVKEMEAGKQEKVPDTTCKPGTAKIKQQYLLLDYKPQIVKEYLDVVTQDKMNPQTDSSQNTEEITEPPAKKIRLKGRNKNRPIEKKPQDVDKLCPQVRMDKQCNFGEKCRFSHDLKAFFESKPPDLGPVCYIFDKFGKCPFGLTCRFGSKHINNEYQNIVNAELWEQKGKAELENFNYLPKDLQRQLWKRKYNFDKANGVYKQVLKLIEKRQKDKESVNSKTKAQTSVSKTQFDDKTSVASVNKTQSMSVDTASEASDSVSKTQSDIKVPSISEDAASQASAPTIPSVSVDAESEASVDSVPKTQSVSSINDSHLGCILDDDIIKLRPKEIKLIDFSNKLYLAPLTTVGNLPFRRICKEYGADITCGEMALSTNLLQGQQSEWALLKRHPSEDIFGVQICGGFPDTMTRCGQLLQENINVDFIDINCGCPIDMVYKKGEGCALMARNTKFEQVVRSMVSVLNIPLTVKMRTGVFSSKHIAHELTPKLRDWGVSLVTLHGRSREQRYTRLADWDYIHTCCQSGQPMPFFGNGDVLSYEDYNNYREQSDVNGIMIARGALIKPWIFKEIKDQAHWDISAQERFEMLQRFCNYGLCHWGSDQQGVDTVRRFLLEWLSFLHRYIPVGLLEHPPQKINQRPPYYQGRNELETLLCSSNCGDWIKLSEMLLGPVKAEFKFLPKHKANAYQ